jgi:hypothetical protein
VLFLLMPPQSQATAVNADPNPSAACNQGRVRPIRCSCTPGSSPSLAPCQSVPHHSVDSAHSARLIHPCASPVWTARSRAPRWPRNQQGDPRHPSLQPALRIKRGVAAVPRIPKQHHIELARCSTELALQRFLTATTAQLVLRANGSPLRHIMGAGGELSGLTLCHRRRRLALGCSSDTRESRLLSSGRLTTAFRTVALQSTAAPVAA